MPRIIFGRRTMWGLPPVKPRPSYMRLTLTASLGISTRCRRVVSRCGGQCLNGNIDYAYLGHAADGYSAIVFFFFFGLFLQWPGITRAIDTPPVPLRCGLKLGCYFNLTDVNPQCNS